MCGRTACTLPRDQIQKACSRRDSNTGKYTDIPWEDAPNGGNVYTPSYNVCPTNVTPVIVAGSEALVLKPMMWGIIPPWHKGQYNQHKLSTNNCRIENIMSSKLYKVPLLRGQRCVVVCDGFYEWQTTKGGKNKQPYFIYASQADAVKIDDPKSWDESFSTEEGWKGPKLLYMAAIFSSWLSPEGEEYLTYSIITMESNDTFSWLHHRMPAILTSDEQVSDWLNSNYSSPADALAVLQPVQLLTWHPVSTEVNNARNKSFGLNKAINISVEKKLSKSADWMKSWLTNGRNGKKRPHNSESNEQSEDKKHKDI